MTFCVHAGLEISCFNELLKSWQFLSMELVIAIGLKRKHVTQITG